METNDALSLGDNLERIEDHENTLSSLDNVEESVEKLKATELIHEILKSITNGKDFIKLGDGIDRGDRSRKTINMRFGLRGFREHTLEEVGKQFGVKRERIRQIEAKVLKRLRHPSRSKELMEMNEAMEAMIEERA